MYKIPPPPGHRGADLDAASPAYLVYLADNIASGIDRRQIEGAATAGFDRSRPQESVYNLLNNNNGRAAYRVAAISEKINCPRDTKNYNPAADYNRIIADLNEDLSGINFQGEYINSLLELCEAYLSYIPSSTYRGEVADISLFDHSKITAALAACMALYLDSQQRSDYRTELLTNRHNFYGEKAFCLFSCDISGIQQFIYTISSKGALKGCAPVLLPGVAAGKPGRRDTRRLFPTVPICCIPAADMPIFYCPTPPVPGRTRLRPLPVSTAGSWNISEPGCMWRMVYRSVRQPN